MKKILKRMFVWVCVVFLMGQVLYQPDILNVYAASSPKLIITEAYIDDITRSDEWGVSIDVFEYVEIYNTGEEDIDFLNTYLLQYRRTKVGTDKTGTYVLPAMSDETSIVVPAHDSIILWACNDSKLTGPKPSASDFREAFGLDESVPVHKVDSSTPNGFYNGYITNFQIIDQSDTTISEANFTPNTTNSDGNSVEFSMPAEDSTSMLLYNQNVTPTPGTVHPEQYEIPQPAEMPDLLITEAYINDIDRAQWVPDGVNAFDVFEYVEIYNPTDEAANFTQYVLTYERSNTEYTMPLYNQSEDVIIPAHSCIVLWAYWSDRYTDVSAEEIPTADDFRSAFNVDGAVPVYQVDTKAFKGFYNTYNGIYRIKDNLDELIYQAEFVAASDTADGKSVEFRIPSDGTTMLAYGRQVDPSPGTVTEEQYTRPPAPEVPAFETITRKDTYTSSESFAVSANITNAQNASLFVKQCADTPYMEFPMANEGEGIFTADIPRTKLWGEELSYYIDAHNDTLTEKSEDMISHIEYSYDLASQPQVLFTEIKTQDTDYNYLEFYNNSDHTVNFAYYNVFYVYPSGLSYKYWTFNVNALYIDPGETLVVWINDDGKTVAQFNAHYGVNLVENVSIVKVDYSGLSPDAQRTIKLGNVYENPIVMSTYHEDVLDDTELATSIHYTYSRDNAMEMIKADISSGPTPGTVAAWQIPGQRVPFDYYGGYSDDASTMVLYPRDEVPDAIHEGEALDFAFDCYDTATGVNTIEIYYKYDDETEYRVSMDKRQRIAKEYIPSIPASEFLGHRKVTFFVKAYNAFRSYDSDVYTVDIIPSIDEQGISVSVDDHEIVGGTVTVSAVAAAPGQDVCIKMDGADQPLFPTMAGGAYFSFASSNLTSYYKNAIIVDGEVIKYLSSWANVNQGAAFLDEGCFTRKENGDYETTVRLRAGTQGSAFEESGDFAAFTMHNMRLFLPSGTFINPDNGIDYDTTYTIGEGSKYLDVHFTIPDDSITEQGFILDTKTLSDGSHVVAANIGESAKNVTIIVDNNAPNVNLGIVNNERLSSGDLISPLVSDGGSGVDNSETEATLDEKCIEFPYTVYGSQLANGAHTLTVSYTDYAGHNTTKSVMFTTDISEPIVTVSSNAKKKSAVLSVQVDSSDDDVSGVEFLEGKKFSIDQSNIKVISGSGNAPLSKKGTADLTTSSSTDLPYQLFEVHTGNLKDTDKVEVNWEGVSNADEAPRMYVLNTTENRWEYVSRAKDNQIDSILPVTDYVKNGKMNILVQSRSDGNLPSTDTSSIAQTKNGSTPWDGTGVPESYDFSFAWITDPQYYVESWPDHYVDQVQWIIDNRYRYNIQYTINTGDLIDEWDRDEQWQLADDAQALLDDAGMPNGVLAGNHDVASGNEEFDNYWKYFGEQRYEDQSYYGGSYQNNLGHYDLISAGGQDFIIIYMSWDVYLPEVEWMNEVLAQYPDRKAIIAIHRYLKQGGDLDYTGELVQNEIVAQNPNVFAVINGHYFGAAIKVDGFDDDHDGSKERKVYQICTDYQGAAEGGLQYLKMIYFDLENDKVYMNSYSPYLDDYNYFDEPKLDAYDIGTSVSSQDIYELDVDFDTSSKTLSTSDISVNVYTDQTIGGQIPKYSVSMLWSNLSPNTHYWWYANVMMDSGDIYHTDLNHIQTLSSGTSSSGHNARTASPDVSPSGVNPSGAPSAGHNLSGTPSPGDNPSDSPIPEDDIVTPDSFDIPTDIADAPTGVTMDIGDVQFPENVTEVLVYIRDESQNDEIRQAFADLVEEDSYYHTIENAVVIDIHLLDQNGDPIDSFTGTAKVKIPIPAEMSGDLIVLWYDEKTGTLTNMNAWREEGYMVFETDHFSYYAIAQMPAMPAGENEISSIPDTGAKHNAILWILIAIAVVGVGIGAGIFVKRRNRFTPNNIPPV